MVYLFYICTVILKLKIMSNVLIKKLAKKIQKENEKFALMSNAEKRVVIANDCIARIKAKQIRTNLGIFIDAHRFTYKNASLKDVLNDDNQNELECQACAKGGLFMAYVGRSNEFQCNMVSTGNHSTNENHVKLYEIFTRQQLSDIEFAFEGVRYLHIDTTEQDAAIQNFFVSNGGAYDENDDVITPQIELLDSLDEEDVKFYKDYQEKCTNRLIAICKNIIKNKGEFIC